MRADAIMIARPADWLAELRKCISTGKCARMLAMHAFLSAALLFLYVWEVPAFVLDFATSFAGKLPAYTQLIIDISVHLDRHFYLLTLPGCIAWLWLDAKTYAICYEVNPDHARRYAWGVTGVLILGLLVSAGMCFVTIWRFSSGW
jgi:hypothetical protein